jgi:hypothetical protein
MRLPPRPPVPTGSVWRCVGPRRAPSSYGGSGHVSACRIVRGCGSRLEGAASEWTRAARPSWPFGPGRDAVKPCISLGPVSSSTRAAALPGRCAAVCDVPQPPRGVLPPPEFRLPLVQSARPAYLGRGAWPWMPPRGGHPSRELLAPHDVGQLVAERFLPFELRADVPSGFLDLEDNARHLLLSCHDRKRGSDGS